MRILLLAALAASEVAHAKNRGDLFTLMTADFARLSSRERAEHIITRR